jgi:hypothetical protein
MGMSLLMLLALTAIDPQQLPEPCRDMAKLADSPTQRVALATRVSLASCIATQQLKPLSLLDCELSMHEVEDATARSFALLDEVASAGDPAFQIIALHAEGELYAQMTTRMKNTLPQVAPGATDPASVLIETRAQTLAQLLAPWHDREQKAYAEVDRVARLHPELARNREVEMAVRDSEKRLLPGVASQP